MDAKNNSRIPDRGTEENHDEQHEGPDIPRRDRALILGNVLVQIEPDCEPRANGKHRVAAGIAILGGALHCLDVARYPERPRLVVSQLCDCHYEEDHAHHYDIVEGTRVEEREWSLPEHRVSDGEGENDCQVNADRRVQGPHLQRESWLLTLHIWDCLQSVVEKGLVVIRLR